MRLQSSNDKLIQKINVERKKCESHMSAASQVKQSHELSRRRSPLPRSLQQKRIIREKASADRRQLANTSHISEYAKSSVEKSEKDMSAKGHDLSMEQRCMKIYDVFFRSDLSN